MLRSVWKLGPDLKIIDVEEGLFQFKFALESQLTWVMSNGPWSFDGTASSVTFPVLPIWMQIWDLPLDLLSEEVGREIGSGVGRVVEVDTKAFTSEQARFVRVGVNLILLTWLRMMM